MTGTPSATADAAALDASLPAVAQIRDACATWGFFQVVNHGVTPEALARFEDAMVRFFGAPIKGMAATADQSSVEMTSALSLLRMHGDDEDDDSKFSHARKDYLLRLRRHGRVVQATSIYRPIEPPHSAAAKAAYEASVRNGVDPLAGLPGADPGGAKPGGAKRLMRAKTSSLMRAGAPASSSEPDAADTMERVTSALSSVGQMHSPRSAFISKCAEANVLLDLLEVADRAISHDARIPVGTQGAPCTTHATASCACCDRWPMRSARAQCTL